MAPILFVKDSVVEKLEGVCAAGVRSLVQDCDLELDEGGFLHSAAVWVKTHLLTASLDVKRYLLFIPIFVLRRRNVCFFFFSPANCGGFFVLFLFLQLAGPCCSGPDFNRDGRFC